MTTARKRLVDPAVTRWYHCISRCVRRAFLLKDGLQDRKAWLQQRMELLSNVFAVSLAGFAILDNHLHMLVRLDPDLTKDWSDEEVARRWGMLYPPRNRKREIQPISPEWLQQRVADPEWIAKRRERLGSLSWYMKALKEPLARLANLQDDCDGHFFAARFKSIALQTFSWLNQTVRLASSGRSFEGVDCSPIAHKPLEICEQSVFFPSKDLPVPGISGTELRTNVLTAISWSPTKFPEEPNSSAFIWSWISHRTFNSIVYRPLEAIGRRCSTRSRLQRQ